MGSLTAGQRPGGLVASLWRLVLVYKSHACNGGGETEPGLARRVGGMKESIGLGVGGRAKEPVTCGRAGVPFVERSCAER